MLIKDTRYFSTDMSNINTTNTSNNAGKMKHTNSTKNATGSSLIQNTNHFSFLGYCSVFFCRVWVARKQGREEGTREQGKNQGNEKGRKASSSTAVLQFSMVCKWRWVAPLQAPGFLENEPMLGLTMNPHEIFIHQ